MSEKVGSIYYDLDLDDKKFNKGADQASGKLSKLEDSFAGVEKGAFLLLGALTAVGVAMVAFGGKSIKMAGDLEAMRAGFITLLGSAEEADKTIKMIKEDAAATPFEIADLVSFNQSLTAVTKNAERSERMLLNMGKAISASGKGTEEMGRVILNLQGIAATGKVTEMDMRQFAMAIPAFYEMLEESTGKSLATLKEDGSLTFEVLEKAINEAGEAGGMFETGFSSQAGTFNQLVSNMKDNINMFGVDLVTNSGLFDLAKEAVGRFTTAIGDLNVDIKEAGGLVPYLSEKIEENKEIFIVAVTAISTIIGVTLVSAIKKLLISLGPIGLVILVISGIMIVVDKLVEKFGGWGELWDRIKEKATPLIEKLQSLWDKLGGVDGIMTKLAPTFQLISDVAGKLWEIIKESLLPPLQELWTMIKEELLPQLKALWDFISPYIIPILKVLGAIVGVTIVGAIILLVGAIRVVIEIIKIVIAVISWLIEHFLKLKDKIMEYIHMVKNGFVRDFGIVKEQIEQLKEWFASIPESIKKSFSDVKNAITKPFIDAFDKIKSEVDKIKKTLDKLNPFHRESPSLVDWINKGTGEIVNQYGNTFNKLDAMTAEASLGFNMINNVKPATQETNQFEIKIDNYYGDQLGLTNLTEKIIGEMNRLQRTR